MKKSIFIAFLAYSYLTAMDTKFDKGELREGAVAEQYVMDLCSIQNFYVPGQGAVFCEHNLFIKHEAVLGNAPRVVVSLIKSNDEQLATDVSEAVAKLLRQLVDAGNEDVSVAFSLVRQAILEKKAKELAAQQYANFLETTQLKASIISLTHAVTLYTFDDNLAKAGKTQEEYIYPEKQYSLSTQALNITQKQEQNYLKSPISSARSLFGWQKPNTKMFTCDWSAWQKFRDEQTKPWTVSVPISVSAIFSSVWQVSKLSKIFFK